MSTTTAEADLVRDSQQMLVIAALIFDGDAQSGGALPLFRTLLVSMYGASILLVGLCFWRNMRRLRSSSLKIDLIRSPCSMLGKQSSVTD